LGCQRLNAHAFHERSEVAPPDMHTFARQAKLLGIRRGHGVLNAAPSQ
jgi:hypothetical protein